MDDISQLLQSKALVLEQLDTEFKEIATQVQEAKKRQTAKSTAAAANKSAAKKGGKKEGTKKGTKAAAPVGKSSDADEEAAAAASEPQGPSYLEQATEMVYTMGSYVVEKRAFVLFGVTAALIHVYGDYASV